MVALEIQSMKYFMKHLLSSDTFDDFLLEEATIRTANAFTIDGHMNAEFFPPEERDEAHLPYEFRPWKDLKALCYDLIKGKYAPVFFQFVLHYKPEMCAGLLRDKAVSLGLASQLKALVLNVRYTGGKAVLTTGSSYQTFVMEKEADQVWDNFLCAFLEQKGIGYEKL